MKTASSITISPAAHVHRFRGGIAALPAARTAISGCRWGTWRRDVSSTGRPPSGKTDERRSARTRLCLVPYATLECEDSADSQVHRLTDLPVVLDILHADDSRPLA